MGSERWSENLFAGNLVARAFLALFAVGFVRFLYRLYKVRTLFRDAQKHGIVSDDSPDLSLRRNYN